MDFWKNLFSSGDFMPHGYCYLWNSGLVWLHVVSDALIALAYLSIPITLVYFVRRRRDLPFHWMFICFGVFIVACGMTHVMEIWNLWHAAYWLAGVVKAVTAVASVPTAILLAQLVPKALTLPSTEELSKANQALEREVADHMRAEEELWQSEQNFRLLVEGVKDYAILRLDPEGRIASWNAGAERIKGYRAEEIIGQHFSRFYSAEDVKQGKPGDKLTIAAQQGRTEDEGWRARKDGSRFWANVVITALRDEKGRLRGFGKITRDMTERKNAEEELRASEERFRSFAETAADAIVAADSRGNIVYFNPAAERTFSYPAAEIIGQPLTVLMPERFRNSHRQGLDRYLRTGEARIMGKSLELVGRRKDDTEFPIDLSLSTWRTREGAFFTAILSDISERKGAEETLKQQTAELARANSDLTAANKELDAFTYSVAHDLRAPLRQIDGFSRILLEQAGPQLESQAQHSLHRIQGGVEHMARLVDDLLNLGRLGRTALRRQRIPLKALVQSVVAELEPEATGRQIEWRIDDLPSVECDPGLMKVVFFNLLSNAVKYTRRQKSPVIEVGQMATDGESAIFVRDNGVGFNMKHVDKLFGIFQRLHTEQDFEGTGVGLATVQRIIHKHGGRVRAEAEPYRGATFYFTLGVPERGENQGEAIVRGGSCQQTR